MSFEDERDEWSDDRRLPALELRLSMPQRAAFREVLARAFDTSDDPVELAAITRALTAMDHESGQPEEASR